MADTVLTPKVAAAEDGSSQEAEVTSAWCIPTAEEQSVFDSSKTSPRGELQETPTLSRGPSHKASSHLERSTDLKQ